MWVFDIHSIYEAKWEVKGAVNGGLMGRPKIKMKSFDLLSSCVLHDNNGLSPSHCNKAQKVWLR